MASAVETQRLISVSLGKIAQSRAQRGGINLHKNLLVASVLNKARTAFMMENYNHQLSLQHLRQSQHPQQVVLTAPQPIPVSNTLGSPSTGGNLPSHQMKTCQATPDAESRSSATDTHETQLVSPEPFCAAPSVQSTAPALLNDKENISPSSENTVSSSSIAEEDHCDLKQDCVSGEQHIEAAHQLSNDAQLAGENYNPSFSSSSCKQTSGSTTCNGVLKRRRINLEQISSNEPDCPVNKKARVSSSPDNSSLQSCDISSSSCENDSEKSESDMQTADSPQITNLVSIFNSGFSGLCVASPSSSSSYESTYNQCENHQWSSRKVSDSQSLCCSSQVERIGSLSNAIVLSA